MNPYGLVQASNGKLYGVTLSGGYADNPLCNNFYGGVVGCGTIFEITTAGALTTLYRFCLLLNSNGVCPDGQFPQSALAQGSDGNLYGTIPEGGFETSCTFLALGCGSVFKITPTGSYSVIYSFCSQLNSQGFCADGDFPGTLLRAANGNFYSTTADGGAQNGGTVFELTPAGTLTTLYSFCNESTESCPDGSNPYPGLLQATDGNFYGTTADGGITNCLEDTGYGCGTIFKVTPAGTLTTLYSFCPTDCYDGIQPEAALAQATNGTLFGLTYSAGADEFGCLNGCGTIFSLTAGLGPFVESNPYIGKIGQVIAIFGSNLTGAESVTFNGTPATTFTVTSRTAIKVTVPAGATTGVIEVTTPGGTLSSNVPFEVLP